MKAFGFDFDLVRIVIFILVRFLTPKLANQVPKENLKNNNNKKTKKPLALKLSYLVVKSSTELFD